MALRAYFVLGIVGVLAVASPPPAPLLIHNASPSMPRGFYVRTHEPPSRGAIVTVRANAVAFDYAQRRGFIDPTDRFIKRVAAVQGDRVCASGDRVHLKRRQVHRAQRDAFGRRLPTWEGCRTLREGEMLLLGDTEDSFDGRYWGVTTLGAVEAVWRPL